MIDAALLDLSPDQAGILGAFEAAWLARCATHFSTSPVDVADDEDPQILEISRDEIQAMLGESRRTFEMIRSPAQAISADHPSWAELKRYLHTLKGSARMAGLNRVGLIAHQVEALLDDADRRRGDTQSALGFHQ